MHVQVIIFLYLYCSSSIYIKLESNSSNAIDWTNPNAFLPNIQTSNFKNKESLFFLQIKVKKIASI